MRGVTAGVWAMLAVVVLLASAGIAKAERQATSAPAIPTGAVPSGATAPAALPAAEEDALVADCYDGVDSACATLDSYGIPY